MSNSRDFLPVGSGYRPDGCTNSGRFRADAIHQAILCPFCLSLLSLSCCTRHEPVPLSSCHDRITQVSVINALMMGRYDGVMPIPELVRYGDFGLGTLDHFDGELIVLDGRAYQVRGDGAVVEAGSDRSTPFAIVTPFEPDGSLPCTRVGNLSDLDARLDERVLIPKHWPEKPAD